MQRIICKDFLISYLIILGTAFFGLLGTINTFLRVEPTSGAGFSISWIMMIIIIILIIILDYDDNNNNNNNNTNSNNNNNTR